MHWFQHSIEGEGWMSLGKSKTTRRGKPYFMYTLFCGIANTDMLLINECKRIFDKYGIGYNSINRKPSTISKTEGLPRCELVVRSIKRVKVLINLIFPYLIGAKKFRAEVILEYIKMRESKEHHNTDYGDEEKAVYEKLLIWKGQRVLKSSTTLRQALLGE